MGRVLISVLIFFQIQFLLLGNITFNINDNNDSSINVYIFKGNGCPHCANALEFFESIEEEYGSYFDLIEYEVWNSQDNEILMNKVAKYLDVKVSGVPFIVIGTDYYSGFTDAWEDDIKKNILDEYRKNEKDRIDVIKLLENSDNISIDTSIDVNESDSLFSMVDEKVKNSMIMVIFLMSSVVLV